MYKLLIKKLKFKEMFDNNYLFNLFKILVVYFYMEYNLKLDLGYEIVFILVRINDEWFFKVKIILGLDINEFRLCGFW